MDMEQDFLRPLLQYMKLHLGEGTPDSIAFPKSYLISLAIASSTDVDTFKLKTRHLQTLGFFFPEQTCVFRDDQAPVNKRGSQGQTSTALLWIVSIHA